MSYERMMETMKSSDRRYRLHLRREDGGIDLDTAIEEYRKLGYSEGEARRYIGAIKEGPK